VVFHHNHTMGASFAAPALYHPLKRYELFL